MSTRHQRPTDTERVDRIAELQAFQVERADTPRGRRYVVRGYDNPENPQQVTHAGQNHDFRRAFDRAMQGGSR